MVLRVVGSQPTLIIPRWTTYICILYQLCDTRGASLLLLILSNLITIVCGGLDNVTDFGKHPSATLEWPSGDL